MENIFKVVFWFVVVPAFLALALILLAVEEPPRPPGIHGGENPLSFAAIKRLGRVYWRVVMVGVVFTLARFSEAFLILRAQNVGLSAMWAPAVLVGMNVAYALSAYPAGVLSDRLDRKGLLAAGLVLLAGADLALASVANLGGGAPLLPPRRPPIGFYRGVFCHFVCGCPAAPFPRPRFWVFYF